MHTLALQAPAPPAPARTAAPPARTCPVCGEALRGAPALRCAQCACGDDDVVVYWYSFSNHYTKRAFTQP